VYVQSLLTPLMTTRFAFISAMGFCAVPSAIASCSCRSRRRGRSRERMPASSRRRDPRAAEGFDDCAHVTTNPADPRTDSDYNSTTRKNPNFPYSMMCSSRVASATPCVRAVAMRNRSAGSP
jgi:hypothetical protein